MRHTIAPAALAAASLAIAVSLVQVKPAHAGSTFDQEWAASSATIVDDSYRPRLQAYFDSHPGYRDCDASLPDGQHVRILLRFDVGGEFRAMGEGANEVVERCLGRFFEANPPPLPNALPLDLPFRLQ